MKLSLPVLFAIYVDFFFPFFICGCWDCSSLRNTLLTVANKHVMQKVNLVNASEVLPLCFMCLFMRIMSFDYIMVS